MSAMRRLDHARFRTAARTGALTATLVLTAALFAGVYVLIEGNRFGWSSPIMLGLSAFCVAALAAFMQEFLRVRG